MDASSAVRIRRTNSRNKEDRISALPDALIQHILCFLPSTREAVRTAILSKRWRRQWTQVPVLIFKPGLYCYEGDAFLSFIENTLALHACPRITKFVLDYYLFSDLIDPQFTSKIRFAITKSVEELILICPCVMGSYLLPKSVIESASLVRLEMDNCYFESNLVVNLPSLKSLKMDTSLFGDSGRNKVIENVVAGCPLLEQLELREYKDEDHFAIVSNTLKILSFAHAELPDAVRITCPNLEEFGVTFSNIPRQMIENVLSGCPRVHSLKLGSCRGLEQLQLVIASNSLKVLHLKCVDDADIRVSCPNLVKLIMFCWVDTLREVENLPSTVCATLDYIRPNGYDDYFENKLLELFHHVSLLTIEKSLFEIISDLDEEDRAPLPLLKCKCLTLIIGASFGLALPGIVYALSSPMLETLVIEYDAGFRKCLSQEAYQDLRSARLDYWNSKRSTSFPCLVSQLKTVKIVGLYEVDDNCEIVLEFIEYMLKNARVLEKMVVSLEESRKSFVIKVSQKMLSFPRYSQCANVELLCST